ncbi:hypothetical protein H4K35_06910 [Myroides sp. NP-2]|uniref:hypothetical protein n=1 Tax=Myroides sp. NP-2 TaxID=2759945 RepID=UPI0015FDFD8D|nr:hypothetical protein [Myroides sp. NP-2]MBB1149865.1 hypothetical protein [Myroides sp. NP-2]
MRNYNHIYKKLVNSDTDLIGHIAYSLYKRSKIDYIEKNKENGQNLSDEDLKHFNEISSSESYIDGYKLKSNLILQSFINTILEEEIKTIKNETVNQQTEILKDVVTTLVPKNMKTIFLGLISSFLFALVIAAIAFIMQFSNSTISVKIQENATEIKKD